MNNPEYIPIDSYGSNEKPDFGAFESVFAWLCVLFGYLFCRALPPFDYPLGMFLICVACMGVTTALLIKKGVRFGASAIVSGTMSLFFALSLIITADEVINLLSLICSVAGYSYFVYSALGNKNEKGFSDLLPLDLINALFLFPFSRFGMLFSAMFARGNKGIKSIIKVVVGFVIAIIPTALVVSFLSYDGGFVALLEDAFSFLDDFNLFSHFVSLLFGLLLAVYFFGLYAASKYGASEYRPTAAEYLKGVKTLQFAPSLTVVAALLPLTVVYVFYFISQWQYYVSGFTGKLPHGVESYAEYARSGFFELCSVSIINFIILVAVGLLLRRKGKGDTVLLKTVNVLFSVMTLVLIGTAMSKMALYIGNYGLTEKRVLATWFMILLAILFVLIILGQFIPKMKLVSACAIAVTAMVCVIAVSNYEGLIADYNVDIYLKGKTDTVDINTLKMLGTPAVPAEVRLAEYWKTDSEKAPVDKAGSIYALLLQNKKQLEDKPFTAFSFPNCRAESALDEFWNKYEKPSNEQN